METPSDQFRTATVYSLSEAAQILRVPRRRLTGWYRGRRNGSTQQPPVIEGAVAPDTFGSEISFLALIEGKVIAACREHGIPLQRIRAARSYLRTQLDLEHPFATHRMLTDGARILDTFEQQERALAQGPTFIDVGGNAGQATLAGFITDAIDLFEFIAADDIWAERFYPAGRGEPLVVDPNIASGSLHIVDSGIRVDAIVGRRLAGESIEFIAGDFDISHELVGAALRFVDGKLAA